MFVKERRNHAAAAINQFMVVYGGIDQQGKNLADLWLYNMELNAWRYLHSTEKLPMLSHHTLTSVVTNYKGKMVDLFSPKNTEGHKVKNFSTLTLTMSSDTKEKEFTCLEERTNQGSLQILFSTYLSPQVQ